MDNLRFSVYEIGVLDEQFSGAMNIGRGETPVMTFTLTIWNVVKGEKPMKKVLLSIALLVLCFSACGGGGGQSDSKAVEGKADELADAIINEVFRQDGFDEGGRTHDKWPDNKFTQHVPKPEIGMTRMCVITGSMCVITMHDPDASFWSMASKKAYAAQLREAGYTLNDDSADDGSWFSAYNSDGVLAEIRNGILITLPD